MNITLPRAVAERLLADHKKAYWMTPDSEALEAALAQPQAEQPATQTFFCERHHFCGCGSPNDCYDVEAQPCHKRRDDYCTCDRKAMLCDGIGEAQPATQQQQPAGEPVAFVIFDKQGEPHHVTAYRQAAHEHINDAITEHDIDGAASWVVRPAYTTPQPRKPLSDELIRSMCKETWVFETVKQWVRAIEAAHGIGGQA